MTIRGLIAGIVFVFALPLTGVVIVMLCVLVLLEVVEEWFE